MKIKSLLTAAGSKYNLGSLPSDFFMGLVNLASAAAFRAGIGLGTAATQNVDTSGAAVPLLNTANTWSAQQVYSVAPSFQALGPIGQVQFPALNGSTGYNAGWYNDGITVYLLSSASQTTLAAAATAGFNNYRPFAYSLSSGGVTIDGTGSGTTFGGNVTASGVVTSTTDLNITAAAGTSRVMQFLTGTSPRWGFVANGTAESGSNAGSDFGIQAYTDKGAYIDTPLFITRAAGGNFSITRPLVLGQSLSVSGATTLAGVNSGPINASGNISSTQALQAGNLIQIYNTGGAADSKYSRIVSGTTSIAFDFVNDAYNSASTWCSVTRSGITPTGITFSAGTTTVAGGNLKATGGSVIATSITGIGQYDFSSGNYNAGWRNDGTNIYFLVSAAQSTAVAAQTASFNSMRPFTMNLSSGALTLDGSAAGTAFGGTITASGNISATGSGKATIQPNGDAIFYRSGGTTGTVYFNSALSQYLYYNGSAFTLTSALSIGGAIIPQADASYTLGAGSARWGQIYSSVSAISTSDGRDKTPIRQLSDAEMAAAKAIGAKVGIYQFLDAVADKGATDARLHSGVIAQDVAAAFKAQGLDPTRYGLYCYDSWDAVAAVEGSPAREPVYEYTSNDDGTLTTTMVDPGAAAVMPVAARAAGDRYGIRYEELSMFLIAAQEVRLAKLEAAATAAIAAVPTTAAAIAATTKLTPTS